jgi:hypothetical protein
MSIFTWSTTAITNQNSDSLINWVEGQAPSTLNDSSRAMMSVLRAWQQDTSGQNTTGGGPVNYTLTTIQNSVLGQPLPSTPVTGTRVSLTFNSIPTGGAGGINLAADSGTSFGIKVNGANPVAGAYNTGVVYDFEFNGTNWIGVNYYPTPFTGNVSTGQLPANQIIRSFASFKDGGGAVISTGFVEWFYVPISFTITGWYLIGDGSTGSITADFQNSGGVSYAGGAGIKPFITSNSSNGPAGVNLTNWTTAVTPGYVRWMVNSVSVFTKMTFGIIGNAL